MYMYRHIMREERLLTLVVFKYVSVYLKILCNDSAELWI